MAPKGLVNSYSFKWRQCDLTIPLVSRIQLGPEANGLPVRDAVELQGRLGRGWRRKHMLLHATVGRAEVVAGKIVFKMCLVFADFF